MAPERIGNERANPKTDLWSLGVVLYESLAGERPFDGSNVAEIIQAVRLREPRDVRLLRPEVPARLSAIVRCLLRKRPRSRYRDCGELLADLDALPKAAAGAGSTRTPDAAGLSEAPPRGLGFPARVWTLLRSSLKRAKRRS
jgi:serine/threonine-protein kinase